MRAREWVAWAAIMLLTGGVRSPLRVMEEGRPYRIVRSGRRVTIERLPDPRLPEYGRRLKVGQRVRVNDGSGFHRGAFGRVEFQEPTHEGRVWVLRDGALTPAYFYPRELDDEGDGA